MIKLKTGQQRLFEKELPQKMEIKIVSQSSVMKTLLKEVRNISKVSSPVLILGENGSGKKMIGEKLFHSSITNNKELIVFNSSGVNADLIDFQFFGSEDGKRKGYLHDIEGKTLLIQNIDSFPLDIQSKLLRFLQNTNNLNDQKSYKFRIICTANEFISRKIETGEFREDLFRYLSRALLIVPSLVEREEDIPELVKIFLEEDGFKGSLDESAMYKLRKHSWKGNIIELKNVCFQIASLYNNQVVYGDLLPISSCKNLELSLFIKYNPKIKLEDLVNYYITQSLQYFKSKKKSAESLNISVKTIYNKIEQGVIKTK